MSDRIAADVEETLRAHVETYAQLKVLMLLGQEPERPWSPVGVADELEIASRLAGEALEHLCAAGLANRESPAGEGFTCHPSAVVVVRALTRLYADDRIELMNLMTSHAMERIRQSALRAFWAALSVGKKSDG